MEERLVALFLLENPPLDEIGGPIVDIIEMYRAGAMNKNQAVKSIMKNYQPYLNKYIEEAVNIIGSYGR